jgi:hypothetical protein
MGPALGSSRKVESGAISRKRVRPHKRKRFLMFAVPTEDIRKEFENFIAGMDNSLGIDEEVQELLNAVMRHQVQVSEK